MTAAIAIGFSVGVVSGTTNCVPIVFLAFFSLSLGNAVGDSVLTPVFPAPPMLGRHEATSVVVYRCAFFALCAGVALGLAAEFARYRPLQRRQTIARVATLLAAPFILAVPAIVDPPQLFAPDAVTRAQCESHDSIRYCVHVGHRNELGLVIRAAAPVFAAYGDVPRERRQLLDASLVQRGLTGEMRPVIVELQPPAVAATDVRGEVATDLAGAFCDGYEHRNNTAVLWLSTWLANGGRIDPSITTDHPWIGVNRNAVQVWIRDHQKQIEKCSLRTSDFR
jgi:hypothetical protein